MSTESVAQAAIQPKQHFSGKVLKINLAGALIDIGTELPGVVHISQIQKNPVNKVEDVLKVGQVVEVWVRRVKSDRIELTMIQPLEYDWKELKPETVVKGKIVRLEAYGAFVDFGAERPGMVHVSELTHGYVKTPGDVVKVGDEVEAMVIDVDRKKKQIRLSIKALAPLPEPKEEPVESAKPERKSRNKRNNSQKQEIENITEEPAQPEPTAFELAWQEALDKQKSKKVVAKTRKVKSTSKQQDDILARTLEERVPTGG
jgi:small subunit ribosomal protein S1